jgi:hypothetical protein
MSASAHGSVPTRGRRTKTAENYPAAFLRLGGPPASSASCHSNRTECAFNTERLRENVFRVAGQPAQGGPGDEQTSASADQTAAPTPSKSLSGSAIAGGVATIARRARRRARRVAPRLRPA